MVVVCVEWLLFVRLKNRAWAEHHGPEWLGHTPGMALSAASGHAAEGNRRMGTCDLIRGGATWLPGAVHCQPHQPLAAEDNQGLTRRVHAIRAVRRPEECLSLH